MFSLFDNCFLCNYKDQLPQLGLEVCLARCTVAHLPEKWDQKYTHLDSPLLAWASWKCAGYKMVDKDYASNMENQGWSYWFGLEKKE